MKKILLTLLAVPLAAAPVWAMGEAMTEVDGNGDGMLSVEEVQAAWPEISTDDFLAMDANADGLLDADEVAAAQEGGVLPAATDG